METIISTFQEPYFKALEDYKNILSKEYNLDTSIPHLKSEDIVRHSLETRRIQDKEPVCNICKHRKALKTKS